LRLHTQLLVGHTTTLSCHVSVVPSNCVLVHSDAHTSCTDFIVGLKAAPTCRACGCGEGAASAALQTGCLLLVRSQKLSCRTAVLGVCVHIYSPFMVPPPFCRAGCMLGRQAAQCVLSRHWQVARICCSI